MSYVMKPDTWKNLTSVSRKPRSKQLKAVDGALVRYHKTGSGEDLRQVKLALHQWKMLKGFDAMAGKPAWRTNMRNSKKGIETLDMQLVGLTPEQQNETLELLAELPFYGIEAWAEDAAREVLKQARDEALTTLFLGKKLAFKKSELSKMVYFMKRDLDRTKRNAAAAASAASAQATASARQELQRVIREAVVDMLGHYPPEVINEVMSQLTQMLPDFFVELAGSMAHYVSIANDGRKAITQTAFAIRSEYQWVRIRGHREAFGPGDPYAAARSLRRMVERERNHSARLAGVYWTSGAAKSCAVAADAASFGAPTVSAVMTPLAGMASALATLFLRIFLLARDIYERRQANKILMDKNQVKLSAEVFEVCPLVGCYFIACANTSDLINFLVEDIGAPGWNLDVEHMVRKDIHPMVGYARDRISKSRLEIQDFEMSKGAVIDMSPGLRNTHNRIKGRIIKNVKSALPWTEKPEPPAIGKDALKARIQGIGPAQ